MKLLFKKTVVFALVFALGLASLPLVNVSAAGAHDPTVPPQKQPATEKLEQVWARQLERYARMGQRFERSDELIDKAQKLIDRAKSNGKDVSALQTALDAFKVAIQKAHPIYESAKGIVNSHQGFDANGKVTDPARAQETVKALHVKFQEIKAAMNGTGKALHEAIRAFRQANPPSPRPSSTSSTGQ